MYFGFTSSPMPPGTPRSFGRHTLRVYGSGTAAKDAQRLGPAGGGAGGRGSSETRRAGPGRGGVGGRTGREQAAFAAGAGVESCAPVPGPELRPGLGRLRCLKMAELGELKVPASPHPHLDCFGLYAESGKRSRLGC